MKLFIDRKKVDIVDIDDSKLEEFIRNKSGNKSFTAEDFEEAFFALNDEDIISFLEKNGELENFSDNIRYYQWWNEHKE